MIESTVVLHLPWLSHPVYQLCDILLKILSRVSLVGKITFKCDLCERDKVGQKVHTSHRRVVVVSMPDEDLIDPGSNPHLAVEAHWVTLGQSESQPPLPYRAVVRLRGGKNGVGRHFMLPLRESVE